MVKEKIKVGIIGGSGLDDPEFLEGGRKTDGENKYGRPSSPVIEGRLNNTAVAVISRHGKGHLLSPTKVPYRANLWALKEAGCTHVLATTACGSLKEEIKPGDMVFLDQFLDFTRHRALTFYDDQPRHTPMAEPFCPRLRQLLAASAKELGCRFHPTGTVVTIEGPRFSTKAESEMFRLLGADVINMTTMPEAILARELGLCYQSVALATDYDCWKTGEEPVSLEMVFKRMAENAGRVKELLNRAVAKIDFTGCPVCAN